MNSLLAVVTALLAVPAAAVSLRLRPLTELDRRLSAVDAELDAAR
ncbi:hypothetical protein [Nakamurella deserti]|nr:hypothetical protein [Nakamurella deserti]